MKEQTKDFHFLKQNWSCVSQISLPLTTKTSYSEREGLI